MLGLLSKPQAAAHLLSSEAHSQASTSTAPPAALTLLPNADTAGASQIPDPQAASAPHAPGIGPAEALKNGLWPSGQVTQPLLAESNYTMSQAAACDAAAREGAAPEYQHSAWQGPAGPGAAQSAPQAAPDNALVPAQSAAQDNALVPAQLPASEPQLGTHTQLDSQAPAGAPTTGKSAKQRGAGKGPKAQRLGAQLTGSAAHALAVLQAGCPSRCVGTEEPAGECLPPHFHCFTQTSAVLLCMCKFS